MTAIQVKGRDLKKGDLVEWFTDGRTVKITAIKPYNGPLANIFPEGAQLAEFSGQIPSGSTIENHRFYRVVA